MVTHLSPASTSCPPALRSPAAPQREKEEAARERADANARVQALLQELQAERAHSAGLEVRSAWAGHRALGRPGPTPHHAAAAEGLLSPTPTLPRPPCSARRTRRGGCWRMPSRATSRCRSGWPPRAAPAASSRRGGVGVGGRMGGCRRFARHGAPRGTAAQTAACSGGHACSNHPPPHPAPPRSTSARPRRRSWPRPRRASMMCWSSSVRSGRRPPPSRWARAWWRQPARWRAALAPGACLDDEPHATAAPCPPFLPPLLNLAPPPHAPQAQAAEAAQQLAEANSRYRAALEQLQAERARADALQVRPPNPAALLLLACLHIA